MIPWTRERLLELTLTQRKTLRDNAARKGETWLVALCDELLVAQKAPKLVVPSSKGRGHAGKYVAGYHFVCAHDTGVDLLPDGRFWSRTWVVSREVAEESVKYGSYLALHETKDRPSYRQGNIEQIEIGDRFGNSKSEHGIDFLVVPVPIAKLWVGNATGEKGYHWASLKGRADEDGHE